MVVNPYVTPTASIVASQTSICSGSAVQFTATSTNGGNSPFYVWVVNGSVWSFGTTFYTNNLNDGDVVLATLWTSAQCSTIPAINSNNITMSVTPSVTPTIAIAASNNNTCSGTSISFTSNITNGGTNPAYQWFINGSPVSGATNAQYNTATLNNNEVVSCQLTSNETCVTAATVLSNNINMVVIPLVTYYADADNDGFGNPNQSTTNCTGMPQGYVTDNTDCNDADPLQHPGQHWFIDNDGDGFGTGTEVIQCLRPLHGYLSSQLIATTGDCDDNNANINPNAQKLTFSASTGFNGNSLILPQSGSQSTTFQFEVVYTDINNQMPPAFFPRVNLDYEGNGVYNNANDRNIVMSEVDANDVTTSDGKKYYASINTLPTGTDWQTRIMISNNGCNTIIGPFNYPDVLIQPDLEIFANDITFSDQHPAVSSPLTVNAVVHNKSDFTANNFVVHLHNQYDSNTVYPDVTVANLAPHASTTVSWNITTPAVPSWNPMQVVVDYTNVINESNELNNSAIRPFTNGNYNLPGGIHAYASVTPTVSPTTNYWLSISGSAYYFDTAVPLQDSSVAGATVNFTIVETGASFSAYTNSAGQFVTWFPSPQIPGLFHITGTVTDYTLTGNFSTVFGYRLAHCLK
jgi:hypothetical protein